MGSVVALEEFRQTIEKKALVPPVQKRPEIRGGEIWGRNYTDIEAIVFGLLKIRDIVAYHVGQQDQAFDQLCMDGLEAAYLINERGPARLKESLKPIKEWILDEMTEDNKRDMSWALVITDLIEKSPTK
ncbi:hypothetical protein [Pseudodesulfovibrio sediminis]|uniref:Uncharacterized protein n=1 Tax=Pseudodesulfovibrio sediminis TaxID=2810563 RepID=A0ABM7P7C2_9BACT|nr:hypothetical protein [Pseudodesulfovibrio sediminis]BCS88885.1 hypothetical protein PSDVSF_21270 [Pseudodesulfovibrio sediminis]